MNVIVVSHRRSGTHLTMDTLVNNFNFDDIINLDALTDSKNIDHSKVKDIKLSNMNNKVFKTHMSNLNFFKNFMITLK